MKSTQSGLREDAREVLQNLVLRRRDAEQNVDKTRASKQSPFAAMTDFSTLPGMHELKLQRSMADVVGLANPFFKMHESRSGATALIDGRCCINFSSYDYLGLNGHPEVQAAAAAAISTYGTSCSASRLVAGERPLHRELEGALAAHYGQQAAIVFVSGHATNVAAIGALLGPRDLVVYDNFAHNSIVLGAMLSGAERRSVPHNDLAALDDLLAKHRARYERVLIVVEGLYSMDGDYPDLPALVDLKKRYGAWLMVDEAHGLGVLGETGKGLFELHGIDPREVDIWMGTLSKTLAGCGGYIAGQTALVEYLKCMAGGFVYSVGMPPPMAAASLAALAVLHREPERVARLRANSKLFWELATARGLNVGTSLGHAVVPVIVHDSIIAVRLSQQLFDRGINVQPIIHPAVPERCARLRFFLTSEHTDEQIHVTCDAIAEAVKSIGDGRSILDVGR
jgi:8-amino-7-oxononanoate synthase